MAKAMIPTNVDVLKATIQEVESNGPLKNLDEVWRAAVPVYERKIAELGLSQQFPSLTHSVIRGRCIEHRIVPLTPAGKARKGSIFVAPAKSAPPVKVSKGKASDVRAITLAVLDSEDGIAESVWEKIKAMTPADIAAAVFLTDGRAFVTPADGERLAKAGIEQPATEQTATAPVVSDAQTDETPATEQASTEQPATVASTEQPPVDEDGFLPPE